MLTLTAALDRSALARSTEEGHGSAGESPGAEPGYRVAMSVAVPGDQVEQLTRLQVLEDERLTPELRESWRGADAAMHCAEPENPMVAELCRSIEGKPLRGAVVRLTAEHGGVLDQRTFERELADASVQNLYGKVRPVLAVTIDLSIGSGSYAGATTLFVESRSGRLQWLAASDATSGKSNEIRLPRTLKSAWQAVPRRDGFDILAVRCQPDLRDPTASGGDARFVIVYERYTFDGSRWLRKARQEPGFWEEDHGFPDLDRFPE